MKTKQEQILSALNKLIRENKTELNTEKVELGLVDDISNVIKNIEKTTKDFTKTAKKIDDEISEYNNFVKTQKSILKKSQNKIANLQSSLSGTFDSGFSLLEKTKKATKELGLNPSDIPEFKKLEKLVNQADILIDDANYLYDIAQKITG